jgi:predicted RND superfamily exporter protein
MLRPAADDSLEYVIRSQGFKLPSVLGKVEGLESFVRGQIRYTVGGVLGPTDQLKTAQFLIEGRAPGSRAIPSNPDRVRWLWNSLALVRGTERVREMVDSTYQRALVTVFLKHANYVDTARLMAAIREHEHTALAPDRIHLEFAGDVAVSQALIEGIVRSQVGSLLLSLLGIIVVIAVLFRSLRWGILCMVPAGVSVAATFAVMGAVGMPLGVATSMFAAMVLGIGVDFAIHLAEAFRAAMARGVAREAAVLESLQATGPAIVVNALAVSLGFGILVFSRVPANAQLGAITLLSLLTCVAATLLVVPALLSLERRRGPAGSTSPTTF